MKMRLAVVPLSLAMALALASSPVAISADQGRSVDRDKKVAEQEKAEQDKQDKHEKQEKKAEYGVAAVIVSRAGAPGSIWATYSTRIGSPAGDTTGGTFRFTCNAAKPGVSPDQAACTVSVAATLFSNISSGVSVYPRVLIQKQVFGSQTQSYCEYGDNSYTAATPSGLASVGAQEVPPSAPSLAELLPTLTPFPINIGGTADCGAGPANVNYVSMDQIRVPAGAHYDVFSTFTFIK